MNSFTKYVVNALLVTPMIASAAVDLVTNGSFEVDSQASGTWNIYNSLNGWTGNPNIELRNNVAGTAYEGGQFYRIGYLFEQLVVTTSDWRSWFVSTELLVFSPPGYGCH